MLKKRWMMPIVIFVFAFSLRLSFIVFWHPDTLVGDEVGYDHLAVSLLNGQGYVSEFGRLTAAHPPAYPIFLSALYFIFGRNLFLVRMVQAIIGSLACFLIYFLGKNAFNRKTGILAGFLSAAHLGFIAQPAKILTEGLSIFFLLCAIIFLHKIRNQPHRKSYYILMGLIMGIASLIRSNLSILFFLSLLLLLYDLVKKSTKMKTMITYIFICMIGFIIPLTPWITRNHIVFHSFIPLSTLQGIAFYTSYKPLNGKIYGFTPKDKVVEKARMLPSEVEQSKFLTKEAIKFIKNNPLVFFKLLGLKLAYLFSPFDWELIRDRAVYNYLYVFYFPFFISGFFLFVRKFQELAYIYLPVLGVIATSVVFFGIPRFRLPIEPYMILLASAAIVFLYEKAVRKTFFISCLSAFFIFNFTVFLNSDFIRQASKNLLVLMRCW